MLSVAYASTRILVLQAAEDGFNIHDVDELKRTPLHVAASTGQDEVIKLLLANSADPTGEHLLRMTIFLQAFPRYMSESSEKNL
jgi:ankyrin repeat protein